MSQEQNIEQPIKNNVITIEELRTRKEKKERDRIIAIIIKHAESLGW